MIRFLHRTLTVIILMLCMGFTTPLWADAGQFKLDMILAKRGDADAQYYVANAFEEGRGTQKNLDKAFAWYSKAAKQNQSAAQYKLGEFYENGLGVEQDIKTAMDWYKKAADNGSSLAKERMNKAAFARSEAVMKRRIEAMKAERRERERERQVAEQRAREEAARKRKAQAKAKARDRARAEAQARAAARQKKVARASKPAPNREVNIPDIVDVVLNNDWHQGTYSADYLPSSATHCLRASDNEVVCFSSEKQRIVNGLQVTYTTKATLSGFESNGRFQVRYNYNVSQIERAGKSGIKVDPHGLKQQKGWQEPQLVANCRTTDRQNLYCARAGRKIHFRN